MNRKRSNPDFQIPWSIVNVTKRNTCDIHNADGQAICRRITINLAKHILATTPDNILVVTLQHILKITQDNPSCNHKLIAKLACEALRVAR